MSEVETWKCPQCQTIVDISEQGFMSEVMCPGCGMVNTVHTVLHNFRLERVLGVGGMSVVLQAKDLVLNRPLAIKVLNETYRNEPERIARFEKECALMAKVRHPNVVSVYSAGVARGQFYIAMELVEGSNLELMVSPMQPMAPLRALSIIRQVAKGLSAANRAGLLHRDIKPGNVLVTRNGRAKVLHFGLSLGKTDEDTEETIWATPFYVPPETLMREPEDVRTDIYALGMTLRYLLSGCETFPSVPQTIEELLECKKSLPRLKCTEYGIDESYADLVEHMTAYDINLRSTGYADLLLELDEVKEAQQAYELARTPEGRKLRYKKSFLQNLCVLLVSILCMWLSFILCEPEPQHSALTVEQVQVQNADVQLLADAEKKLQEGKFDEAAQDFVQLSRQSGDASLGAWGAMVAMNLADFANIHYVRYEAEQNRKHQLQRSPEECASVGAESLEQLRIIDKARMEGISDDERKRVKSPLFKAFLLASDIIYNAEKNDVTGAEVKKELAAEAFAALPPPYNCLQSGVKAWNGVKQIQFRHLSQKMVEAWEKLDYDQILSLCQDFRKFDSSSVMRRYTAAKTEMCKIGKEIDALLSKKFASQFRKDMSAQERIALVEKLNNKRLTDEVRSLYSFIQKSVDKAIEDYPYRYSPDSTEPYAILARRWLLSDIFVAPVASDSILLISSKRIVRASVDKVALTLSGPISGKIVTHSKAGLTVQDSRDENKYTGYVNFGRNVYCEVSSEQPQSIWVELSDVMWRGPCCLQGDKLIRPVRGSEVELAQILHRNAEGLLVRWEKDKSEAFYKKSALGLYLRQGAYDRPIFHLVDQNGEEFSFLLYGAKNATHGTRRTSINEPLSTVSLTQATGDRIVFLLNNKDQVFIRGEDGIFRHQESRQGGSTARLNRAPWLISKDTYVTGVSLLENGARIKIDQGRIQRQADVVHYDEKSLTLRWADTGLEEKFNQTACDCYLTANLQPDAKFYSIIDYRWRGICVVSQSDKRIIRRRQAVETNVKVTEANDSFIRIEHNGEVVTYRKDASNLYVREDSAAGKIRMFATKHWIGYVGITPNGKALHFWNAGGGIDADVYEEAADSYTLCWLVYKTVEKFVKQSDGIYWQEEGYKQEDKKAQIDNKKKVFVQVADPFLHKQFYVINQSLLEPSNNQGDSHRVAEFVNDKFLSVYAEKMPASRKLQDGTEISFPRQSKPVHYDRRYRSMYFYRPEELPDGAKAEVLEVHDAGWSGPLTVYIKGDVKKAWRAHTTGSDSADVLFYDGKRLEIKWHRWGKATYIKDDRGAFVYKADMQEQSLAARFRDSEKEASTLGEDIYYMGVEKGKVRRWLTFSVCTTGEVLKFSKEELRFRWRFKANEYREETFRWDESKKEYVKQ